MHKPLTREHISAIDRRRAAIHEAGHVVMARHIGLTNVSAWLEEMPDSADERLQQLLRSPSQSAVSRLRLCLKRHAAYHHYEISLFYSVVGVSDRRNNYMRSGADGPNSRARNAADDGTGCNRILLPPSAQRGCAEYRWFAEQQFPLSWRRLLPGRAVW